MNYQALAEKAVSNVELSRNECHAVLRSPDADILRLLDAAFRVRRHFRGTGVRLHLLVNAKSGLCSEDCGYCSQSRVSTAQIEKYPWLDKETLVSTADVITLHLVLSERSRGTIGPRELALMKPTAVLINTSRGPIIEQWALVSALKENLIAGAALDVYDEEPLAPDHPLRSLPDVVLTPHLGYVTEENYRVFYGESLENIRAYLDTGLPTRLLNPEAIGRRPPATV